MISDFSVEALEKLQGRITRNSKKNWKTCEETGEIEKKFNEIYFM